MERKIRSSETHSPSCVRCVVKVERRGGKMRNVLSQSSTLYTTLLGLVLQKRNNTKRKHFSLVSRFQQDRSVKSLNDRGKLHFYGDSWKNLSETTAYSRNERQNNKWSRQTSNVKCSKKFQRISSQKVTWCSMVELCTTTRNLCDSIQLHHQRHDDDNV